MGQYTSIYLCNISFYDLHSRSIKTHEGMNGSKKLSIITPIGAQLAFTQYMCPFNRANNWTFRSKKFTDGKVSAINVSIKSTSFLMLFNRKIKISRLKLHWKFITSCILGVRVTFENRCSIVETINF